MSLVISYESSIRIPSLVQRTTLNGEIVDSEPRIQLLVRSLQLLAEDYGGNVVYQIQDVDGQDIPCLIGVKTPDLPQGFGIQVEADSRLSFVYDAYGDAKGLGKRLAGEIQANYNALALKRSLSAMGYQVNVQENRQKQGRTLRVEARLG